MENWFILTLSSSLFAGLQVYTQKIGSVRGYNSSLVNSYSAAISAIIILTVAGLAEGLGELSWLMVGFSLLSGLVYIVSTNLRMDAIKYVDVTILLPLHKFISPLIALFIGILIFNEQLTRYEWIGIIIGMLVPLLLISRLESSRQNNFQRGLILLFGSAVLAAAGVAISKEGTSIFSSVLLFAAVTNIASASIGLLIYRCRNKETCPQKIEIHFVDKRLLMLSLVSGVFQGVSFMGLMLAFREGGPLAVVYTIHSLYIFIPIVLSIVFYSEHWNLRKVVAIFLSLLAVWFMK